MNCSWIFWIWVTEDWITLDHIIIITTRHELQTELGDTHFGHQNDMENKYDNMYTEQPHKSHITYENSILCCVIMFILTDF